MVFLDRSTYDEKINTLLSDRSIVKNAMKIEWHTPIAKKEWLFSSMTSLDAPQVCNSTRVQSAQNPNTRDTTVAYCVFLIASLTYYLSKVSTWFRYSPLVGQTSSSVHNSWDFVSFLRSVQLQQHQVLVSFDVVSLFSCNCPGSRGSTELAGG